MKSLGPPRDYVELQTIWTVFITNNLEKNVHEVLAEKITVPLELNMFEEGLRVEPSQPPLFI